MYAVTAVDGIVHDRKGANVDYRIARHVPAPVHGIEVNPVSCCGIDHVVVNGGIPADKVGRARQVTADVVQIKVDAINRCSYGVVHNGEAERGAVDAVATVGDVEAVYGNVRCGDVDRGAAPAVYNGQ